MPKLYGKLFCIAVFLFISCSATWPQPASVNTVYRVSQVIDTFNHRDATSFVYIHSFTYDKQGRPVTDTWDRTDFNGKLQSSRKLLYTYDNTNGRLLSRVSDTNRYGYFYDDAGNLKRIAVEFLIKDKWVLCEETVLEKTTLAQGKTKLHIILNKLKNPRSPTDTMRVYFNIEYTIDKNNNVSQKRTTIYDYNKFRVPLVSDFVYDNNPNPVQQIMLEQWYDWELDNSGFTNLVQKKIGSRVAYQLVYEYNEAGYPIKCIMDRVRTRLYKYESVAVTPQKTEQVIKVEDNSSILLYPNPASTEVNIKAGNLGQGIARVRVYDINGVICKEVNYTVADNTLEVLITLSGLAKGTYVVEILSPKTSVNRKLILL